MPKKLSAVLAATLVAAGLAPGLAAGQEVEEGERLTGEITVYSWLPAISGTADAPGFKGETKVSRGDVLDSLQFAFMTNGTIRYGRWGALADWVYSKNATGGDISGANVDSVHFENKMNLVTLAGSYRVFETPEGAWLDALAGARYVGLDMDTQATLTPAAGGQTVRASASDDWIDPLIGLRGRYAVTPSFGVVGTADIGGFGVGSDFSWELYGGVDYLFTDRLSGKLGFRYISIDRSKDGVNYDMDLYGPALGIGLKF